MNSFASKIAALGLCLGASTSGHAATAAVSILPTETRSLLTVPDNRTAVVRSVVVSNPSGVAVCDQQVLLRSRIKTSLCVPAGSSFQLEFSPALAYKGNESIDLKNGDAGVTTVFTVNYRTIAPGRGLIEKEK